MSQLRARVRSFAFAHVGGTALVLIYHRVTDLATDPQLLAVSPANFDAQMRLLARDYHPISLAELVDGLKHRRVRDRSVVVTFDDGYADNLLEAAPILEKHGVPATVFVCSGYLGGTREFWWDELERVLLRPDAGNTWNVLEPDALPIHAEYREAAARLRSLSPVDREAGLQTLRELAGLDATPRPTHRQLTAEQVAELDAHPGIDVGAHTVNHAVLSARPVDEQRVEIESDRDELARLCGHPIPTFSYPYGSLEDYSAETVELVSAAGFDGACSNHTGVVKPWTDRFRIPRVIVRDWDAPRFSAEIAGWFDDPR